MDMRLPIDYCMSENAGSTYFMKIVIFSIENIQNIGEEFLGTTTQYLIEKIADVKVERKQLVLSARELIKRSPFSACMYVLLYSISKKCLRGKMAHRCTCIAYQLKLKKYYEDVLKNADAVVIAVGMLKYTTQNFSYIFELLNECATVNNIPVMMSAMSIQSGNRNDLRYHQLVRAVNFPSVKAITTRDGEIGCDILRRFYVQREKIAADYVGDPALWIPECYQVKKRPSELLGIGIIRKRIYKDYGTDFSEEQLMDFYIDLIEELQRRNMNWVMFCNGMPEDYEAGLELIERLNLPSEKLLPRPRNAEEFLNAICGFKAVFGARLHACIAAFALDIPVAGLLWNSKLECFSQTMKIRQFFSTVEELKGNIVVDKLEGAIKYSYDKALRDWYKMRTKKSIQDYLHMLDLQ